MLPKQRQSGTKNGASRYQNSNKQNQTEPNGTKTATNQTIAKEQQRTKLDPNGTTVTETTAKRYQNSTEVQPNSTKSTSAKIEQNRPLDLTIQTKINRSNMGQTGQTGPV
jgi:hypothetical protein